jgi:hypothetical protein
MTDLSKFKPSENELRIPHTISWTSLAPMLLCTFCAAVTVALRCYSKAAVLNRAGIDDAMLVISLVNLFQM